MNALVYLRVSTKEQAEKGESGEGYSTPLKEKRAFATAPRKAGMLPTSSSTPVSRRSPPTGLHSGRCFNELRRETSSRSWFTRSTGWRETSKTTSLSEPP